MTKVERQVQCASCAWNRNCIEPPHMTEDEVKAQMEESKVEAKEQGEAGLLGGLMSAMFFAGKDREATVCPVIADTLRDGPELSQYIKDYMRQS